jgi:hypothetical protein
VFLGQYKGIACFEDIADIAKAALSLAEDIAKLVGGDTSVIDDLGTQASAIVSSAVAASKDCKS